MNKVLKSVKKDLRAKAVRVAITIMDLPRTILNFFSQISRGFNDFWTSLKSYLYNDWLTNFPSNSIRILYLKYMMNVKIGKSNFIHMGCRFEGDIKIGNNNVLGRNCVFKGEIYIENNVSITAETYIFTSSHIADDPNFNCFYKTVEIHDRAWIGARAMIMPGVKIGRGAVLAASAVLTKDIPDFNIFAGVPAKFIGTRNPEINYTLNYFPFFQ